MNTSTSFAATALATYTSAAVTGNGSITEVAQAGVTTGEAMAGGDHGEDSITIWIGATWIIIQAVTSKIMAGTIVLAAHASSLLAQQATGSRVLSGFNPFAGIAEQA